MPEEERIDPDNPIFLSFSSNIFGTTLSNAPLTSRKAANLFFSEKATSIASFHISKLSAQDPPARNPC